MGLKKYVKFVVDKITDIIPISNVILFESSPEYTDNTKAVFDEMLRRNLNNEYKLIWACEKEEKREYFNEKFQDTENVFAINFSSKIYKFYYRKTAKAFICCNMFLEKAKPQQYYCNLAHGCALKNAVGYSLPPKCKDADVMTISKYMAPFDAYNLSHNASYMRALGYARNDDLFNKIDVKKVFNNQKFSKIIYWLPTYRQNRWHDKFHSDISMPILYTENEAKQLNSCAKDNDVLVVVKVHPAQDLSKIQEFNLSNVLFISNDFFLDKNFTNYQLLGSCDALLSDYSSVYYDYLLCDKPIGLCWDDFDEYNKREGFTVDPMVIMKGGVKLYNIDDLCAFVESIAKEKDELARERNEIKNLVHDHIDNKSTKRIVDYLEKKISL